MLGIRPDGSCIKASGITVYTIRGVVISSLYLDNTINDLG